MALRKITDNDLEGKGVIGMADVPGLSAREMQQKVEEIVRDVVIPVLNENIDKTATMEDLGNAIFNSGAGDMTMHIYDTDNDGTVNAADNGIFFYTHSGASLTGQGENGKFKATASGTYTGFAVNGTSCSVVCGEDSEIELVEGAWYTFILDGNTINFKQGGAGLNFKVVGSTTAPASPKENTLWVNTDVAIGEYQFSAAIPETRTDGTALQAGDVWIVTNAGSNICFNALKKNGIATNVVAAYQWDGLAWGGKTVKGYIGGEWIDSDIYIFSSTHGINQGSWKSQKGTITVGDTLYVHANSSSYGDFVNNYGVDLTNISTVEFTVSGGEFDSSYKNNRVGVVSDSSNLTENSFEAYTQFTANGTYTVDTSALNGVHYLKAQGHRGYSNDSYYYIDNILFRH